nr:MAG TPA: hypothetical protein [Caudoviricetes sp.]
MTASLFTANPVILPPSCAPGGDCYKTFMHDGSPGLL